MGNYIEKSFDFAADLSKQLITLSSGIIAITVTFAKDIFNDAPTCSQNLLFAAWIVYFISIIFGIWHLMALTGTLAQTNPNSDITIHGSNCRIPAFFQILLFLIGLILTIAYAVKVMWSEVGTPLLF